MSAIQFLTSGGMASIGGDIPEEERKILNEIVKQFGEKIRQHAMLSQVPASYLLVQQSSFLLIARDTSNYHFLFANAPGGTSLQYRDLASHGRFELQNLIHQIRMEVGEVTWGFSTPLNISLPKNEDHVGHMAEQYVNTVLQSLKKPNQKISDEAISNPEIAAGLEKFRTDHPLGNRTAFIIMQFGNTKLHQEIVTCVKQTRDSSPAS